MQYKLPLDHGLPSEAIDDSRLLPRDGGNPSLTDAQFSALEHGVARGKSALVVAPTSTGKTLIGLWTMASALKRAERAVYLVTHRALANQKFSEIKDLFLEPFLFGMRNSIVLATGDEVIDGDGAPPSDPLGAAILVATYEKYVALLSAGGLPSDMSKVVIVCDEIQLIGDESRGQCTELLLTVLKKAHCRQIVGLSAVIDKKDAGYLAEWLEVALLYHSKREKKLVYEFRTPMKTYRAVTG